MTHDLLSGRRPRWLRQLFAAVRLNAHDVDLWGVADLAMREGDALVGGSVLLLPEMVAVGVVAKADVRRIARSIAAHVSSTLPYRFDGPHHMILELPACRRRGYGACGDGAAAICAGVLMAGGEATLCYQDTEAVPGYAHVRIDDDGAAIDAYPEKALPLSNCSAVARVTRRVVRWPSTADADAVAALDERRRAASA